MPVISGGKVIDAGLGIPLYFAGAPVDGTSGTFVNVIEKNGLLIDTTNSILYINSGTKASPVYSRVGPPAA